MCRVEVQSDIPPIVVAVGRQLVGRTRVDRPAGRFRSSARKGIASNRRLRCSRQLWRLCDGAIPIQEQLEFDNQLLRMRRTDWRTPALTDLAEHRVLQI